MIEKSARSIVALKNCSTDTLSDAISKVFKMIFNHIQSFHGKNLFYIFFKKFWVVENSLPIVTKLNEISTKKQDKSILTFDFITLYTTISHSLLIIVLSEVINFVFKSETRSRIGTSV